MLFQIKKKSKNYIGLKVKFIHDKANYLFVIVPYSKMPYTNVIEVGWLIFEFRLSWWFENNKEKQ